MVRLEAPRSPRQTGAERSSHTMASAPHSSVEAL